MNSSSSILNDLHLFNECLKDILNIYTQLPSIIEEEHRIILLKDLKQLESITQKKSDILDYIKKDTTKLKTLTRSIESNLDTKYEFDTIEYLISTFKNDYKENTEYKDIILSIESLYKEFRTLQDNVSFSVEQNKYLLNRLIEEKRNNFIFWQDIISEKLSSYNKQGIQKSKLNPSVLKVSA